MNKALLKLIAASLSLALAVTVAVMSTYAWFTLTTSPEVAGAAVVIGGSNTIMLAPDLTMRLEDGTRVHFPGSFSDKLVFSGDNNYEFLSDITGLAPVSTADGIRWIIPVYNTGAGVEYVVDSELSYANQTEESYEKIGTGNYVFLDFWVVAPAADYRLRVSSGEEGEGCFLVGLPMPEETDTDGDGILDGYQMVEKTISAAASARVGFLVNELNGHDNDLHAYETYYKQDPELFKRLKGRYSEQWSLALTDDTTKFTIYEPNGTLHAGDLNDTYLITSPLNASGQPTNIQNILMVQDTTAWLANESGTILQQSFEGMASLTEFRTNTVEELASQFYDEGKISSYVDTGKFFSNTQNLYAQATDIDSELLTAEREKKDSELLAGATSDVFIVDLEKNVPQRIRMFIWLEATDADCSYDAQETSFVLRIELAGSNMKE